MNDVTVIFRPAPGIAMIDLAGDRRIWTKARIRGKPKKCTATGIVLHSGAEAYRPFGNANYRYLRLHADYVDRWPLEIDVSGRDQQWP